MRDKVLEEAHDIALKFRRTKTSNLFMKAEHLC
jgi:hypothetical protein